MINHVLLIDDDDSIRKVANISLTRIGNWQVTLAASAKQAFELLSNCQPDVILLDVMMPGMDGPSAFRVLQEMGVPTPVIFMTAKVQKHEVQCYYDLGAAGVIMKPFDPITLPAEIKKIVGAARPTIAAKIVA